MASMSGHLCTTRWRWPLSNRNCVQTTVHFGLFIITIYVFLACVYFDLPYGLGLASWDVLLSDTELTLLLNQLAIIVTNSHALVFNCIWSDLGRVKEHMSIAGYQDIHPVYVHKPQQNAKELIGFTRLTL